MFEAPEASVKFTSGQAAMVAKICILDFPIPPEVCTARRAAYLVAGERPVTDPDNEGASPVKDHCEDLENVANNGSVPYSIHATAGILGPPTVAIPFKVADTVWPRESIEKRVTVGARVWVAIPVTGIAWGLPTVLSVTVNVVLLVPAAVGEKLI